MSNGHRGAARMQKHWHFIPRSNIALTGSSTAIGGSLALDGPWTVIRMLGHFTSFFTAGGTVVAGDKAFIGIGIGVVSSDAVSAGAGSVPDPSGEPDYPWLYWTEFTLDAIVVSPEQTGGVGSVTKDFDIRSMRKLKPRESLIVVAEYVDLSGAPLVDVSFSATRVLVAD